MAEITNIKCPNCGTQLQVEDVLYKQAEERIKKEYEQKTAEQSVIFRKQSEILEREKEAFEQKKQRENELFEERLTKKMAEEKERMARKLLEDKEKIKKESLEEFQQKITVLEEENTRRRQENTQLKQREVDLMNKEKQLKERQEEMQLDLEKKMLQKGEEIAAEARKKEAERNELRVREFEKKLDDQKRLIEEMQRKAEQGSMQMQGEVMELALEEILRSQFAFDIVEEVGKGVRGADVIHTVMSPLQQVCGKIIYESKRTKAFSDGWIEKLKQDQREQGAALAILVTETLPKDMEKFGRRDGVWICTFSEFKGISFILREMVLREHSIRSAGENKGDKMELLYNYLISDDFRSRVEAIVEGFSTMKIEMDKEKRAMQNIWKAREKQIDKVITNTIDMYGSIRGIAGSAISPVKALELPGTEEAGESSEFLNE